MKSFTHLIAFCSILLALASCGKEKSVDTTGVTPGGSGSGNGGGSGGGNSNGTEVGNWNFVSLHAITSETTEFDVAGTAVKAVVTSDYTTDNNTGNVKFDGTTMFSTNVGYSVNTTMKVTTSSNGIPAGSQILPFAATMPPTSASVGYKKIGTDSLYFATGVITGLSSNGSVETKPGGYKLKWDGDKMYMTLNYTETTTADDGSGVMQKVTQKATIVTTLQKQ
jgi:hypothetical protein